MNTYIPGTFAKLAGEPEGKALWEFLNTPESVLRMETASYLKRPALEALQPSLIKAFGEIYQDDEQGDRWKQMTGNMARQILEHHGYEMEQERVKIRTPELFSRAARYRKK